MKMNALRLLFYFLCSSCGSALADSFVETFGGTELDWCRWEDVSQQGATVSQADALRLATNGSQAYSNAQVLSQARYSNDFDVEVQYRRVSGFSPAPLGNGLLISGVGLYWDQARYIQYQRILSSGSDQFAVYSSLPQHAGGGLPSVSSTEGAGAMRMVRNGSTLKFLYASGAGWVELGSLTVPATPVHVLLFSLNTGEPRSTVVTFGNYRVNAATTDDVIEGQGAFFHKRDDFAVTAFTENYPVERYWRGGFTAPAMFTTLRQAGFEWSKTSVTTETSSELAAASPEQWRSLGWQDRFWSSREYAAQTLADSSKAGMRLEVQLLLSPHAAYWGYQQAPAAWAGKSVAEIAALLEENVYQTAKYFKDRGLNVERYAIGNEIDIGILDFLPNVRVTVPSGVNFPQDMEWLRANIWQTEATLLQAAIKGVKRAEPSAAIILHIGGLEFNDGNVFPPAFFQAMDDFGVQYDYAALSHPYASYPWKLDRYTTACWFKRLARTVARIHGVSGKPVMMVEASYPGRLDVGNVAPPMRDFPFTPQGQASWVREQLRFASTHPEIKSWHYFYPDMPRDLMDLSSTAQVLASASSLFETAASPRPALDEFKVNLAQPSRNAVEFYNATLDHYFVSALSGDIDALDSGQLRGWARTGEVFRVFPSAREASSPVCRFYIPPANGDSHFYSASPVECTDVAARFPAFVQESTEVMDVFLPALNGTCIAGAQPVFRVWNARADTNHRYTTNPAIRDQMLARGYVPEGYGPDAVAMCVPR